MKYMTDNEDFLLRLKDATHGQVCDASDEFIELIQDDSVLLEIHRHTDTTYGGVSEYTVNMWADGHDKLQSLSSVFTTVVHKFMGLDIKIHIQQSATPPERLDRDSWRKQYYIVPTVMLKKRLR